MLRALVRRLRAATPTAAPAAIPALALSLIVAVASCGDPAGPGDGPEPITQLPRGLTAAEESVISAVNAFGFELGRELALGEDDPNLVFSPFSASMALGMTLNGAAGETFDAMRSTLAFEGLSQEEINASYRGLIDLLTTLDPNVEFTVGNAMWANEDYTFHQEFFDEVGQAFDAAAETRDFADPAVLQDINDWVDERTNGKIRKLLDELSPDLVMLLVNAIYFEGAWTTSFDPADTRRAAFTRPDGSTVDVDMMSLDEAEIPLGYGDGYSAAELPYGGEAWSMVIVVPNRPEEARDFFTGLDVEAWHAIVGGLESRDIDLISIPKLRLSWDSYLNEALKALGMGIAFRPGADFTGLSPQGNQMCIDFVRQKTFIEVDEEGTRAAAVTGVGIGPTSFNGLIADRPFIFAIRERLSGTILFVGLVEDPTAEEAKAEDYVPECM